MALIHAIFLVSVFAITACQNTPCRNVKTQGNEARATGSAAPAVATAGVKTLKIKVFKADGSLQCGMGKKISLDEMQKELKGIQVFNKYNQNDGLMRIQVCGSPTGDANIYEINQEDLEKAIKLGFKQWTFN